MWRETQTLTPKQRFSDPLELLRDDPCVAASLKLEKIVQYVNAGFSARGALKLHPFSTSAERSEARVLKGCNFNAPQALNPALILSLLCFIA